MITSNSHMHRHQPIPGRELDTVAIGLCLLFGFVLGGLTGWIACLVFRVWPLLPR